MSLHDAKHSSRPQTLPSIAHAPTRGGRPDFEEIGALVGTGADEGHGRFGRYFVAEEGDEG